MSFNLRLYLSYQFDTVHLLAVQEVEEEDSDYCCNCCELVFKYLSSIMSN